MIRLCVLGPLEPFAMSVDDSVTRWIAELELGRTDEAAEKAQEELWRRYFKRLMGLANLKLGQTTRSVADEEDVATAALNSFFTGAADGRFPRLHDRHDLWPLLAKITARKALDQQRWLLAEKRGGGRVQDAMWLAEVSNSLANCPAALIDEELGPEVLVTMSEQCDRLMAMLPDDELRQIARRRLEGYTNAEIATEIDTIERTVERRLQLIRSIWSEHLGKMPVS
jgi:DNA-directed RNA polymerase specialized sigma24 family protein